MDGQMGGWTDGWVDGRVEGRMGGRMGGWTDGWIIKNEESLRGFSTLEENICWARYFLENSCCDWKVFHAENPDFPKQGLEN